MSIMFAKRYLRSVCAVAFSAGLTGCAPSIQPDAPAQVEIGTRGVPLLQVDALSFRDLNRNGVLDPYEDWRLTPQARADDLVARMTLADKAGTMMFGSLPLLGGERGGFGGTAYDFDKSTELLLGLRVNSAITRLTASPGELAEQHNALQEIAERGPLGIPLTVSTDPRNHFQVTGGASVDAGGFSVWPETTGMAAIGDADLVRRFGEIARREYRATGIHMALSPMADLATEPRWPRVNGTFGEDAQLARALVGAYIEGFQGSGSGVTAEGVASVVKHWVGYGAAADKGFDSHSHYGRFAAFPGDNFAMHLVPFERAFEVGVAGVMPTYSILRDLEFEGRQVEQVGGGFNRWLLTDLLRGRYGFEGVILSDWLIASDCPEACIEGSAPGEPFALGMPWGVESLSKLERYARGVDAGLDQFGGSEEPQMLIEAVEQGLLTETRLDASVRRILVQKFRQGLFENPFVDPDRAAAALGDVQSHAQALDAQRRSLVLLKNQDSILPLSPGRRRVYLHGIDASVARDKGLSVVDEPADAELAIVRLHTPFERLHPNHLFGTLQNEGNLAFASGQEQFDLVAGLSARGLPVIATVYLDRPAVLTALLPLLAGLYGDFGVSDHALLDVVLGAHAAEGRLPFELPSSMAAVEAQKPDVPHDSQDPLFPYGFSAGIARDRVTGQ